MDDVRGGTNDDDEDWMMPFVKLRMMEGEAPNRDKKVP
jgi:hypothetical protein